MKFSSLVSLAAVATAVVAFPLSVSSMFTPMSHGIVVSFETVADAGFS